MNYRTSHQIRGMADKLLPAAVQDADGVTDQRNRTVSIFEGPIPELRRFATSAEEAQAGACWLKAALSDGTAPSEIGVFVRSQAELRRARDAIIAASAEPLELSDKDEAQAGRIAAGTMHLAKGLEFKAVVVMACDDDLLPLRARL